MGITRRKYVPCARAHNLSSHVMSTVVRVVNFEKDHISINWSGEIK